MRAEHESQQTQRYPAAEDPHRRVLQGGLPGGVRKTRKDVATNRRGGVTCVGGDDENE